MRIPKSSLPEPGPLLHGSITDYIRNKHIVALSLFSSFGFS